MSRFTALERGLRPVFIEHIPLIIYNILEGCWYVGRTTHPTRVHLFI